jgi:hypothetical protein
MRRQSISLPIGGCTGLWNQGTEKVWSTQRVWLKSVSEQRNGRKTWIELIKENILKYGISRNLSAIGSAMQNSPMTKAWKRMLLSTLNLVMMIMIRERSCWSARDVPADNKNKWQDNSLYMSQDIFDDYIQTVWTRTKAVRKKTKLPRATAVLLCGNRSSHLSEGTIRRLTRDNRGGSISRGQRPIGAELERIGSQKGLPMEIISIIFQH